MRLLLVTVVGWCIVGPSNAFTYPATRLTQKLSERPRLINYSTRTSDQPQQQVLRTGDTEEFIQSNIEVAAAAATPLVEDDVAIISSSNGYRRFHRVVGPKQALIYDTTLRGMFVMVGCVVISSLPLPPAKKLLTYNILVFLSTVMGYYHRWYTG